MCTLQAYFWHRLHRRIYVKFSTHLLRGPLTRYRWFNRDLESFCSFLCPPPPKRSTKNMAIITTQTSRAAGEAPAGTSNHANGNAQPSIISHGTDTILSTNGSKDSPSYPKSRLELVDRFVDEPRKLRVAVIGGGLAGILSGCLLPAKVPGVELVIYEKNPDFVSSPWPHVAASLPRPN